MGERLGPAQASGAGLGEATRGQSGSALVTGVGLGETASGQRRVSLVTASSDLYQGFNMVLCSLPANASDGGARADNPGDPAATVRGVMD